MDACRAFFRFWGPRTGALAAFLGSGVASAAQFAYVANFTSDTVSVLETTSYTLVTTISVGRAPYGIAANSAGTRVYVTNREGNTLSVIDTFTQSVVATIPVGNRPWGVAVDPSGKHAYVSNNFDNTVTVIDTLANAATATIETSSCGGSGPGGIVVNPAGTRVYVVNGGGSVYALDTATDTLDACESLGLSPENVAISPDGATLYATGNYQIGGVIVVDAATLQRTALLSTGWPSAYTGGIAVSPGGDEVYVAVTPYDGSGWTPTALRVLDPTSQAAPIDIAIGDSLCGVCVDADWVALSSDGGKIYVSNQDKGTVSIIDAASKRVIATPAVGQYPTGIALVTANPFNVDQHGLTGSWYNPATGGQGIEIELYPDLAGPGQGVLFGGWFTFDVTATGGQRWYALQGATTNGSDTINLDVATGYGGNFNAPPAVAGSIVGHATLQFSNCNTAKLTYAFSDGSGRTGTIPLSRLIANVTCSAAGDNGNVASDYLLSGSWFDTSTGGQGLIFDINPVQSFMFAAWYTFAPNGQQAGGGASQRWYTLQSGEFTDGTTSLGGIGIYTATGGVFDNATATTAEQVGTASILFQSCNALVLSYTFTGGVNSGKSGIIHLARTGPTPSGCRL